MVFQDEQQASWFSPLNRLLARQRGSACLKGHDGDADGAAWGDRELPFELADRVEAGFARAHVPAELELPTWPSSQPRRFLVVRSDDRLQYRLFAEGGRFLMCAQVSLEARRVQLFLHDLNEHDQALCGPARPAFTMAFGEDRSEWRLVREQCAHCRLSPKRWSCACSGKQQVAFFEHRRKATRDAVVHGMEVHVPGLSAAGRHAVWCPRLGWGDLEGPLDGAHEVQQLNSTEPVWYDGPKGLALDFRGLRGRDVVASAKNFQLALHERPDDVVCEYLKNGEDTFVLDIRHPLSAVQAFGASLTTIFWA